MKTFPTRFETSVIGMGSAVTADPEDMTPQMAVARALQLLRDGVEIWNRPYAVRILIDDGETVWHKVAGPLTIHRTLCQ